MTSDRLVLTSANAQTMLEHVRRWAPEEACGLLAGAPGMVKRVYLIDNIRHSQYNYFMDPGQQVSAMLEIDAAGLQVNAIFHSHPAGPPVPSLTDINQAYYPEAVYIIWARDERQLWSMRGFEIDGGTVREVPVEVSS